MGDIPAACRLLVKGPDGGGSARSVWTMHVEVTGEVWDKNSKSRVGPQPPHGHERLKSTQTWAVQRTSVLVMWVKSNQ